MWEIGSSLKHLVLPPLGLVWLVVAAWFVLRRRPAAARWLLGIFVVSMFVLATPAVSTALLRLTESGMRDPEFRPAHAVVILAGGRGLEYDGAGRIVGAYPSGFTLERLHAGARIARRTGLPVLVTGGSVDGHLPTEAEVMRRVLERDYGIRARWVEEEAKNTVENAQFSARLLHPQKASSIILVTHAFHMRRARWLFATAGFDVQSAPVNPASSGEDWEWRDFLPNAQALLRSYYAFNEMGGIAYARLRAAFETPAATVGN